MKQKSQAASQRFKKGQIELFRSTVWNYFKLHGRDFPWRKTTNPYRIAVSELMLQQTQTYRVVPKYKEFLRSFPTVATLATSSLLDVLKAWQGLGYNRRARYLHELAKVIVFEFNGRFPRDKESLLKLPGIGPYTAAAINVFSFNNSDIVIETNVRSAYIHHFFPEQKTITDKELIPLITAVGDSNEPRLWHSALMDYGAYVKSIAPDVNKKSSVYNRQSPFKGSFRELRALVLRHIIKENSVSLDSIHKLFATSPHDIKNVIQTLVSDGIIKEKQRGLISIA